MKKIRKTYSGVVPNGKVLNSRNNSQQDTYSSDYLNRTIPDTNDLGEIVVDDIKCKNIFKETSNKTNVTTAYIGLVYGEMYLVADNKYTLSFNTTNNGGLVYINEELFKETTRINCDGTRKSIVVTAKVTGNQKGYSILKSASATTNAYGISDVQLEEGTVASKFVKHKDFENKEIYSTSEQVIGTWIDDKPLYRRVINTRTPDTVEDTQVAVIDTTIKLKKIDGVIYNTVAGQGLPINFYYSTDYMITTYATEHAINMKVTNSYTDAPVEIVLEYTKTTD